VGEPDPPELGGVDDRSQGCHELLALHPGSGVDQHRFTAMEHERVDRTSPKPGIGKLEVRTSMSGAAV
jgi:hypothetical protein